MTYRGNICSYMGRISLLYMKKNGTILTNKMPYFCVSMKHNASYIMAVVEKKEANCFT